MTQRPESIATRTGIPREPVFLSGGVGYRVRTFVGDFVNFTSTFVYYVLLATFGAVAYMIDNMFRTHLFEIFLRIIERIDHGKESVIEGTTAPDAVADTAELPS